MKYVGIKLKVNIACSNSTGVFINPHLLFSGCFWYCFDFNFNVLSVKRENILILLIRMSESKIQFHFCLEFLPIKYVYNKMLF